MKLQLVVTVLLVGFMFTLSLAMAGEEGDARAVLQAIRMLLVSESHGHGELQQAENVTSAPSNQLLTIGQCEVEDSNKVECGYYGITRKQCEDVCCCWQESNVSGVLFCYQKVETAPRCQAYERVECGYFGIDKLQCWRKGCCYSPTTASGQSWCYHEKATEPQCQTDAVDRIECGYHDITAEQCKANGCCWSPTNVAGAPWCFTKSSAPSEAGKFACFRSRQFQHG